MGGLKAPATGTSTPLMKTKSTDEVAAMPFAAMPSFKVTKDPNDLNDFCPPRTPSPEPGPSRSFPSADGAILSPKTRDLISGSRKPVIRLSKIPALPASGTAGPDLLAGILSSQSQLMAKADEITIGKDGSLAENEVKKRRDEEKKKRDERKKKKEEEKRKEEEQKKKEEERKREEKRREKKRKRGRGKDRKRKRRRRRRRQNRVNSSIQATTTTTPTPTIRRKKRKKR